MSKTLHLIRHAKSSWKNPDLEDIERPLNKRGKRDCQLMANPIVSAGCDFSNVFSSPAKRARKTVERMFEALPIQPPTWKIDDLLYTFQSDDLLAWIRGLKSGLNSVVCVGHNPALTDLCQLLVLNCEIDNVPTCGYVQLTLECDQWQEVAKGCATIQHFLFPKQFKQCL